MKSLVLISMLAASITGTTASVAYQSSKVICPLMPNHEVIATATIYGSEGTMYHLYEMDDSYGIYEVEGDTETFCEGSYSSNSPYYLTGSSDLKSYLGA